MAGRKGAGWLALAAMLAGCGGDGGSLSSTGGTGGGVVPTPTPSPTAGCGLRDRQQWVRAQLDEWYLFPDLLATGIDPAAYGSVDGYVDALVAPARAAGRDRYFTYVTSIADENAYYEEGETAGLGLRLGYDTAARRVYVIEAFEGAPALAAGMDRGTEILGVGASAGAIQPTATLIATGGAEAFVAALGADTAGVTRVFQIRDPGAGVRIVTVTKAAFDLTPVSSRYGAKVIEDGGRRVGYINLRTFIETAEPALRDAFARFRAEGVREVIVDLRYNGGGLVSIAELMGDLMGADRTTGEVFSYTNFRAEKSAENETRTFDPQPQSIAPLRVAFIGTGGTASASELVINAFVPYLGNRAGLIGTNTYGKPVGQIALDREACDDRLRVVAFAVLNADRQGGYYNGLATTMRATCRAEDDVSRPLGDPGEASTRQALDFLAGRACTPIAGASGSASASAARVAAPTAPRELLMPARPTTPQREVPGLF